MMKPQLFTLERLSNLTKTEEKEKQVLQENPDIGQIQKERKQFPVQPNEKKDKILQLLKIQFQNILPNFMNKMIRYR
jgi:hypothetical protein